MFKQQKVREILKDKKSRTTPLAREQVKHKTSTQPENVIGNNPGHFHGAWGKQEMS